MSRHVMTAALALYVIAALAVVAGATQESTSPVAARTVWDGVFTDEQAEQGRAAFAEHCATCHGPDLGGGEAKALSGDRFWMDWKETTVDYLLGQISTNMPYSEDGSLAGSLPASTYAALVAYILKHNGFPAGTQPLTADTSAGVPIIREEGPGDLPASTLAHVVGCLARGTGGGWRLVNGTRPVRVLSATPPPGGDGPLGDREYRLMFVLTPLEKFAGYRMSATGLLMGEGGADGLNVSTIAPVRETCD